MQTQEAFVMWIADKWKDYEVLDTSAGEKLERWGNYILLRPDPQVLWDTPKLVPEWKKLNGHYHRSNKGGGEWEFFSLPEQWTISYELSGIGRRLTFNLKPFSFKHTGLFPEQAANWEWFTELIDRKIRGEATAAGSDNSKHISSSPADTAESDNPKLLSRKTPSPAAAAESDDPKQVSQKFQSRATVSGSENPAILSNIRVLNLFAYTGGATIAAAAAGAHVTHVDASKGMTGWAKENAKSSGIEEYSTRWLVDDCQKFVEREIRRGNKYDGIIMDPPSYGRGPKGEIWKIEDNIFDLIKLCSKVLKKDGLFFLVNSYTTGLQPAVLSYMLNTVLVPEFGGKVEAGEVGLPVSSNGLVLPCGAAGRWYR